MLCTLVINAMTATLRTMSLEAGRDFEVVLVSFDPRETPALASKKKAEYLARYDRAGTAGGWHFLTGDEPSIQRLTGAAGFRYTWDEDTKQFAHPAGIIVATPDGRPARYLFGIEYGPRDVRLALVEASEGKVGTPVDAFLLYCYHYDPESGRFPGVRRGTLPACLHPPRSTGSGTRAHRTGAQCTRGGTCTRSRSSATVSSPSNTVLASAQNSAGSW